MSTTVSRIERYVRFALHPRHRLTLAELADPRGRCNRHGFLVVAIGLIISQLVLGAVLNLTGIGLSGVASLIVNGAIFILGLSVCVQRLHDLNLRAWVIPVAVTAWFTVSFVIALALFMVMDDGFLKEGSVGYAMVFLMMMVPAFGGLLWLHTAPGQRVPNRFGPVPGRNGFARAPQAVRTVPERDMPDMSGAAMA
jgi:uncharacterized membrane protein YhaH (DUF805 family)